MLKKVSFAFILLVISSLSGRQAALLGQSHIVMPSLDAFKVISYPNENPGKYASQDTLKILAVMVNFQKDKDEATFGDGTFGTINKKDYGNSILDPLPHDKAYFEAHLEFVKNYFRKVSGGKLVVQYFILPDTFSVSKRMRDYSPPNNSSDFTLLADFSKEVWQLAAAANPGINFGNYNLFTIFHAGVGRDISLPGSLGNERDLPSIYLGINSLKKIYGNDFNGFPVSGGFNITNSMIMPETESREVSSTVGEVLFEVTINGLLAANIASHLGLPDLFDTETGLSAIGRFGLMDGQSIFAYNGAFPPEPSAWEKMYLGWIDPIKIEPGTYNESLVIKEALKVPVNSSEYFLLENRARDSAGDGAKIKYVLSGDTLTRTFFKDTTGFYSYDTDSLQGVIVDMDEFDWAIPGSGILIWHIDDNIINANIGDNRINADKDHRGVNLMEADGIQDIGEVFTDIFGNQVVAEGAPEDLWFSGNKSKFYTNRFSGDTRPNSNSNSGANSLITVSDFSGIANTMSFKVSYGDSIIKPVLTTHLSHQQSRYMLNSSGQGNLSFDITDDSLLYRVTQTGSLAIFPLQGFSTFKPASYTIDGTRYTIGVIRNIIKFSPDSINASPDILLPAGENITAPPVINTLMVPSKLFIGTSKGRVLIFTLSGGVRLTDSVQSSDKMPVRKIIAGSLGVAAVTDSSYFDIIAVSINPKISSVANAGKILDAALAPENVILNEGNTFKTSRGTFSFSFPDTITSFSMADLKNDGNNYILFTHGNNLEAVNLQGAKADNFPFVDPLGLGFKGTPLAADFEGDGKSEVIAYTKDGRIFAIDGGTGKVVKGFPLSAGSALLTTPVLLNNNGHTTLAVIDSNNNFYAWTIGADEGKLFWAEANANNTNSASVIAAERLVTSNEFFPLEKTYNYPNPVYGSQTAIHYYVSEDSKINIKIFDLAGDFVAELNDNAQGGFEKETNWNVNSIQSGVYLARIEATSVSGKTENNIIKIAIVK